MNSVYKALLLVLLPFLFSSCAWKANWKFPRQLARLYGSVIDHRSGQSVKELPLDFIIQRTITDLQLKGKNHLPLT